MPTFIHSKRKDALSLITAIQRKVLSNNHSFWLFIIILIVQICSFIQCIRIRSKQLRFFSPSNILLWSYGQCVPTAIMSRVEVSHTWTLCTRESNAGPSPSFALSYAWCFELLSSSYTQNMDYPWEALWTIAWPQRHFPSEGKGHLPTCDGVFDCTAKCNGFWAMGIQAFSPLWKHQLFDSSCQTLSQFHVRSLVWT